MIDVRPEPFGDSVFILAELKLSLQPISVIEMHLFAYLACLLGLWQGRPVGDWGYSFAVTSEGFPFSADFENARELAVQRGLAHRDEHGRLLPVPSELDREIDILFSSDRWSERRKLIGTAVSCALALPVGSIRYAMGQSPGLRIANALHQRSALLTDGDVKAIYDEYSVVKDAIDLNSDNLLAPAVVWLSARILDTNGELEVA